MIAQHLEGEAVSMRNPDKRWHHTHIHRILDNETYKGTCGTAGPGRLRPRTG